MTDAKPKLFISYSWSSPDHMQWVLDLASSLRRDYGVDVILDQWDLRHGHDKYVFMEQMVSCEDVKKVAMICDKVYVEKANGRSGGVGTETQIISPEIYNSVAQDKFVAVIVERDENGEPYVPVYYRSKLYIDLTGQSRYSEGLEELVRWIHDRPLHIKPEIGPSPNFDETSAIPSLGITHFANRSAADISNGRSTWRGVTEEYFENFSLNVSRLRMSSKNAFDEKFVMDHISATQVYRDEFSKVISALGMYRSGVEFVPMLQSFFEGMISQHSPNGGESSWSESEFISIRFLTHELLLLLVATLLRSNQFEAINSILADGFYIRNFRASGHGMVDFGSVCSGLPFSLEPGGNKYINGYGHTRVLVERCNKAGIAMDRIMEADLILFLRSAYNAMALQERYVKWYPFTLFHAIGASIPFEQFAKARSKRRFEQLAKLIGFNSKQELIDAYKSSFEGKARLNEMAWEGVELGRLIGLEQMCSVP